jgi:hypothetical protein
MSETKLARWADGPPDEAWCQRIAEHVQRLEWEQHQRLQAKVTTGLSTVTEAKDS